MSNLTGKRALVTGGGSGIGRAIALALAAAGGRVAIAGRREDALRETAQLCQGEPAMLSHAVDVADRDSVNQLFAWAAGALGPIDLLVNAAGINTAKRMMADMPPATWDQVMAINATGAYNCIYAVLPQNISSVAGKRASMLGGVAYSASKFAMTALGTAVALEEGQHGIRVTNIYPGEVDTPILQHRPSPITEAHRAKILRPESVAEMVLAVAQLPPQAHVPELVIKPVWQDYA
jgi:NAD(P)-dependent dehydrogenase (short-subunit alcohol dehydrogenase family)